MIKVKCRFHYQGWHQQHDLWQWEPPQPRPVAHQVTRNERRWQPKKKVKELEIFTTHGLPSLQPLPLCCHCINATATAPLSLERLDQERERERERDREKAFVGCFLYAPRVIKSISWLCTLMCSLSLSLYTHLSLFFSLYPSLSPHLSTHLSLFSAPL